MFFGTSQTEDLWKSSDVDGAPYAGCWVGWGQELEKPQCTRISGVFPVRAHPIDIQKKNLENAFSNAALIFNILGSARTNKCSQMALETSFIDACNS